MTDADRLFFLEALRTATRGTGVAIHAYVLMTNHVRLLATQVASGGFANAMQSVGRRYVAYFNRRHSRTGTLWEGRYHASLVASDFYLLACYRYIEQNPVRAGLARGAVDYLWSSHRFHALSRPDSLVTPHDAYLAMGEDPDKRAAGYRAVVR